MGSGSVPPLAVRSGMTMKIQKRGPLTFLVVIPDGRAALGAAEPEPTKRRAGHPVRSPQRRYGRLDPVTRAVTSLWA